MYASTFFHVSFVFHSFCSRIYPFRAFSGLFVINQTDIPDFARFPPPFFDIKPTRKQKGEPPNPRPTALLFLCFLTFRDAPSHLSILHKNKRVAQQTSDDPPFGGFPYIFSLTTRSMYAFCASVSVGNGFRQPPQSTPCVLRMCLMDGNSEQETSACMMLFARF